jgi:mRNA-degrading endonuclease RelE of RelBE toxin-antitoxin system
MDPRDQERILRAIKKKLSEGPGDFGSPLGGGLKGFWKLKVGAYRVIYRIFEKEKLVDVALVGFRRNEEANFMLHGQGPNLRQRPPSGALTN